MIPSDGIVTIKPETKPYLTILWQVNNWCNFKCSYCNEYSNGGDYKNNDKIQQSLNVFERIIKTYQSKGIEQFFLKLTGGEPSAWKGTISVAKKFSELVDKDKRRISLNTNLSRDIDWWKENYKYFDIVIGSFHTEFTDVEHYLNISEFLQDKVKLKTKIMMNKNSWQDCLEVARKIKERCETYRIEYTPVLASLTSEVEPYYYEKQEHLDFFETHNNENKITFPEEKDMFRKICITDTNEVAKYTDNQIIIARQNTFKDWTCNVYENLFISRDGDIHQSTCGQGRTVGNIFEGLVTEELDPVVCKKEWCHCGVDIMNTKTKEANYG
tara:strand:- start:9301 stop:10281 length:981 start_codon:yes stop_codon:yes gene_type:complete